MVNKENCCQAYGPKIVLAIIGMVLLSAIVIVAILRDRIVNQQQWTINVIGQSKVIYQPDVANVTVGVQVDKAAKADDALKQIDEKVNKIYTAMEQLGIPKEDIQTQNYSLYTQYDYLDGVSASSGYNANQTLVIKVKKIKENNNLVSQVISSATKAGANQISGISFEASNMNELKQDLRLKAINDARSKAGITAKALGVRLDKVVGWWENFISSEETYYDYGKGGMGAGGVSPVVPAGSRELIMEVNLNYKIK